MKPVFSEITYESFELRAQAPLMGQQEEFYCTCQTWLSESAYLTLYTPSKKKGCIQAQCLTVSLPTIERRSKGQF